MDAGRKLDALVAEGVMGWVNVFEDRDPDGEMHFWVGVNPEQRLDHLPKFSSDIAAAFQVVDILRQRMGIVIAVYEDGSARVELSPLRLSYEPSNMVVTGGTVPLAICRAALAAVASKVPTPC